MLHSYHYYACYYYALLCLLHQQQQQAAAITIIIEGAQTNEWATRDEYQRQVVDPAIVNTFARVNQQQQQQQFDDGSPPAPPPLEGARPSTSGFDSSLAGGGDGGESEIPTVELIQARLNQRQRQHHHQAIQPARRRKERELAAKKYCGKQLIDMLENICNSRYYSGEAEPQTVEPTVKTRRSLRQSKLYDTLLGKQQQQQQTAQQQTSARSLINGPTSQDDDNTNIIINTNNDPFINGNLYHGRPLLRRIRGASEDCCRRSCHADELKLYCQL